MIDQKIRTLLTRAYLNFMHCDPHSALQHLDAALQNPAISLPENTLQYIRNYYKDPFSLIVNNNGEITPLARAVAREQESECVPEDSHPPKFGHTPF